jgi:hypothetical protein
MAKAKSHRKSLSEKAAISAAAGPEQAAPAIEVVEQVGELVEADAAKVQAVETTSNATSAPAAGLVHRVVSTQGLANRQAAAQRTAAGKFNKVIFAQIGGHECPKFGPWTWMQRDKFMDSDTAEANIVRSRYEEHLRKIAPEKETK